MIKTASQSAFLLLVCLTIVGCDRTVQDTEGRSFSYECRSNECALTQTQGPDFSEQASVDTGPNAEEKPSQPGSADSGAKHVLNTEGRLLSVCSKDAAYSCRPLKCESSGACSALGGRDFTCEKNLCQAAKREITPNDRLALCLAKTGKWSRTTAQLERMTLATACRPPGCEVPTQCMSP